MRSTKKMRWPCKNPKSKMLSLNLPFLGLLEAEEWPQLLYWKLTDELYSSGKLIGLKKTYLLNISRGVCSGVNWSQSPHTASRQVSTVSCAAGWKGLKCGGMQFSRMATVVSCNLRCCYTALAIPPFLPFPMFSEEIDINIWYNMCGCEEMGHPTSYRNADTPYFSGRGEV